MLYGRLKTGTVQNASQFGRQLVNIGGNIKTLVAGANITITGNEENVVINSAILGTFTILDGTEGSPGIAFSADLDTGMYRPGDNQLGFSTGGSRRLGITNTTITVYPNTVSTSSITGALVVNGGVGIGGSVYINQNLNVAGTFSVGIILFGDGTQGAPSISFTSDSDTGIYRIGSGNIGISCNNSTVLDISSTTFNVSNTLNPTKTGNTTSSLSSFYSSPASTALSAANDYYFNYFATPSTSGSTTGITSTVHIQGAPSNATTTYALRLESGNLGLGGGIVASPTVMLASGTISANAYLIILNSNPMVATLATTTTVKNGQQYFIINANAAAATVSRSGSDTFDNDGVTTSISLLQNEKLSIVYYNGGWYIN